MNPNNPIPAQSFKKLQSARQTGWRQLLSLVSGSVLAIVSPTATFAQTGFELVNWYQPSGQTMSGAAVLGLPGDYWNTFGASPVLDAHRIVTQLTLGESWVWVGMTGLKSKFCFSMCSQYILAHC